MMAKRLQWSFALLTLLAGGVFVYAQNPVSIAQVGTTAVTTTVPVSGTVTAVQATGSNLHVQVDTAPTTTVTGTVTANAGSGNFTVVNGGTFAVQAAQSGTWTVQPGNTANTTAWKVDGSAVTQPVSLAGTQAVNVAQMNGVTTTMGNGTAGTGVQRVAIASDNTTFTTAPVATATTTDGVITTNCYITSAASTNATNCKASAGNVYFVHVTNTTTTNYFLRLYNSAGTPTCSSATGFIETVPALGASANGGVNGRVNVIPQSFTTGIGFCLTGGGSSTDNTNAATGVYVTIGYK